MPPTPQANTISLNLAAANPADVSVVDGEQRDLNAFLSDQKRFEEGKRKKQAQYLMEQEELERKMQAPKMNARSRRILERKQGESANKAANG